MSALSDAKDDAIRAIFGIKADRFQKQRIEVTKPAVGLLGFATMISSPVTGDYGLVAPTLDGLRAAFAQLRRVEPFDESAVTAVTIVRTGTTQPVPELNVTEWISGDVKPGVPGVYQRMHREVFATTPTVLYSRWDGTRWFVEQVTAEEAAAQIHVSMHQDRPWRGLAEPPR